MGYSLKKYIFAGLGLIAGTWFLASYPSQDLRSTVQSMSDRDSVEQRVIETLANIGYAVDGYDHTSSFKSNRSLLDSLQHHLGRSSAVQRLRESHHFNIKPFYWEVQFTPATSPNAVTEADRSSGRGTLIVRADTKGRVIELRNADELLPDQIIQRNVLQSVFFDSIAIKAKNHFASISDSLLRKSLYFDFQPPSPHTAAPQPGSDKKTLKEEPLNRLSAEDARQLAEYYLQKLGWNVAGLYADSMVVQRVNSVNVARVWFKSKEPVMGQHLTVSTQVAPMGGLISLQAEYNSSRKPAENGENIWEILQALITFLFGLGTLIIFFFRSRARAVDPRSALVAGIIAGLAVPLYILLDSMNAATVFDDSTNWMETVFLAIRMGMSGAFSSVAFFVLFATGDSLTRQYWPRKLESFDYLRQGLLHNKVIGRLILRSLVLAVILAGGWSGLLWLFPDLYLHFDPVFYSESVGWPLLYLFLEAGLFSFVLMAAAFLVVGSQIYAQTKNFWLAGTGIAITCGLITPVLAEIGPSLEEAVLGMTIGVGLAFIYLRWDFLTVLIAHFLFLGLLGSSSGWVTANSPDVYMAVFFLLFLIILGLGGALAYFRGSDERTLSKYVPGYVEELAQEERIRQELQIAREVQQSFLPVTTPDIPGIDLAAFCRPAHETGGDYYDFIRLDDRRIALVIGDVSGKGIQAAFYMTFIKGVLHSLCRETDSPAELLIKANRLFYDNAGRETFISLVYGIIDLELETFTFARAGHNPVIRVDAETDEVEELRPLGLGLGLTKDTAFQHNIREVELPLKRGDLLVLYTDGVVEALSERHQFYGNKRLIALLKKHKEDVSPEILSALFNDITMFIGKAKQHDDMTAVVLKLGDVIEQMETSDQLADQGL